MSTAARASCFDASALLKLYVQEDGSDKLREYWNREPTKFTTSLEVFFAAQRTAEKHKIDLSDAFQIHTVKEGFFSNLSAGSKTILVSADRDLVKAARAEGLRVWSILDESPP
jgi:predicted nucleic acid-binding protein